MTTSVAMDVRGKARPLPATDRQNQTQPASPIVKWAGGKGRLLSQLRPLLPPGVDRMRHVEPFAGGAAFFFARAPERALLCDVNHELIATYVAVRDQLPEVIKQLKALARRHCDERYYVVRSEYNEQHDIDPARRAAMFIYLNKTCFNGLHRVNRRGEFNVPVGRYENPRILDASLLSAASAALQRADLRCEGFEVLLQRARPGDFVYLDPPYEPVSRTASFTSYAKDGFTPADQTRLRDVYAALSRRRCRLMLSNSDTPLIRDLYRGFRIDTVAAPRAINCNGGGRGRVTELVIRNYSEGAARSPIRRMAQT